MRNTKIQTLALIAACAFSAVAARGETLFTDNYNSANDPSLSTGINDAGRQGGTLSPIGYTEVEPQSVNRTRVQDQQIEFTMTDALEFNAASPNINFDTRGAGFYTFSYQVDPNYAQQPRYGGAVWGTSSSDAVNRPNFQTSGYGFILQGSTGDWTLYDGTSGTNSSAASGTLASTHSGLYNVTVETYAPTFDGSTAARTQVYVDGTSIVRDASAAGLTNNYVGVNGFSTTNTNGQKVRVDNVSVSYGYTPTADAMIQTGSNANTNFGSATTLVANDGGSGGTRYILARFDLSAYGEAIDHAKLELDYTGGDPTGSQSYDLYGLIAGENWDESTVTWNNSGLISGGVLDLSKVYGGAALATFDETHTSADAVGSPTTAFDVSSGAVLDFLNADADGIVTLLIAENSTGGVDAPGNIWASKENGLNFPFRLTVSSVPTPAALPAGLALLTLGTMRRRRRA